jgi:hypothetical protein
MISILASSIPLIFATFTGDLRCDEPDHLGLDVDGVAVQRAPRQPEVSLDPPTLAVEGAAPADVKSRASFTDSALGVAPIQCRHTSIPAIVIASESAPAEARISKTSSP